jgi:hypothetical protein
MIRTALQRQQDAERDLWQLLESKSDDRVALGDVLRSVLATAEMTVRPSPPLPGKSHVGFAGTHVDFFRQLGIYAIDAIRAGTDPKMIYGEVRERVEKHHLQLTAEPWNIEPDARAAA